MLGLKLIQFSQRGYVDDWAILKLENFMNICGIWQHRILFQALGYFRYQNILKNLGSHTSIDYKVYIYITIHSTLFLNSLIKCNSELCFQNKTRYTEAGWTIHGA